MDPSITAGIMLALGGLCGYQIAAGRYRRQIRELEIDVLWHSKNYQIYRARFDHVSEQVNGLFRDEEGRKFREGAIMAHKAGENG